MPFHFPCKDCGECRPPGEACRCDWNVACGTMIFAIIIAIAVASLVSGGVCKGENFTAGTPNVSPELLQAAEEWRADRAIFWTGSELPDWEHPCPIVWIEDGNGAGATSFGPSIQGFAMSMEIHGNRDVVLLDVLPHEVDHAVRATILRKPISRLFDEGAAGLPEGLESHARLNRSASLGMGPIPVAVFDSYEYPQSSDQIAFLYGFGYSFSEFVVEKYGQDRLLQLHAAQKPSEQFVSVLGASPHEVVEEWRSWFIQSEPEAAAAGEFVEFHSRAFCQPCQRFEKDWKGGLLAPYRFKQRPGVAPLNPTFYYKGQSVVGYDGPEGLLKWLQAIDAGKPGTDVVPKPFQRATPGQRAAGPLSELSEAKDAVLKLREDFQKFQESGPLGKLAMVGELKGDVAAAKASVEEIKLTAVSMKEELAATKQELSEYTEKGYPIWYAIPAALLGLVKRRFNGAA